MHASLTGVTIYYSYLKYVFHKNPRWRVFDDDYTLSANVGVL